MWRDADSEVCASWEAVQRKAVLVSGGVGALKTKPVPEREDRAYMALGAASL